MAVIDILAFSCPLLLCAMGALYSDYAGILAIFLEGLVSFSAYFMFYFTVSTGSAVLGMIFTCLICVSSVIFFASLIEKLHANPFIGATAINLLFSALPTYFATMHFKNRGVLTSEAFIFPVFQTKLFTVIFTLSILSLAFLFLLKTRPGLYIRITGTDSDVLKAKGVNPVFCRIQAWAFAAFFASLSGAFLCMRVSSFVPGISSGRGWMALAAVFLGKKKPLRIVAAVIIFCLADIFSANIQNYISGIPSSFLISLPYLVSLLLILVK